MAQTTQLVSDIITGAARKMNLVDQSSAPSAEDSQALLALLNDLLAEWRGNGTDLGWFTQTNPAATAPLDDTDVRVVKLGLAMTGCTEYGIAPPPTLPAEFDDAYSQLRKRYFAYIESASELPRPQSGVWGGIGGLGF